MKRTYFVGAVTLATSLIISAPLAPAADLIEKMPEQTFAAFGVRDFAELKRKFEASRFHDAWQSPELESMRTMVAEQWEEFSDMAEEEYGIRPDNLLSHFQGAFVAQAMFAGIGDDGDVHTSYATVAEVPADKQAALRADVERLLEKVPDDAAKSMETFRGIDIYRVQFTRQIDFENPGFDIDIDFARPFDIQYAFTDDLFLLAEGPKDPLKVIIASMDDQATSTLGRTRGLQALKAEVGDLGDTHLVVNFPQIFSVLAMEPDTEEAVEVIGKLGISDIGPALMSFTLTDYGLLQELAMPTPQDKKGLLAMLAAGRPLQLNTARLVPSDASTYVAWTLDVKELWDALRAMILDFSPESEGFIDYGFLTANANFEVDIESDILAHVRGEHAIWMKPIPAEDALAAADDPYGMQAQTPQVLFLGLENGQNTIDTLNRLFRRLVSDEYGMPLEESDIRGTTVWVPTEDIAGELPVQPALGLSPSGLIIASSMLEMQDVLRRVGGDAADASIAGDSEFDRLYQALPQANLRMVGYSSPRIYKDLDSQIDAMYFALMMMAEGALPFDRDDIPNSEWFMEYFGPSIQAGYVKPDMIRIHQKSLTAQ